jgi:hypothetical protein
VSKLHALYLVSFTVNRESAKNLHYLKRGGKEERRRDEKGLFVDAVIR